MPENNLPSAKPDPEIAPGEFDFVAPVTERPRVRRRSLAQTTAPRPTEEAAPVTEKTVPAEVPASPTAPKTSTATTRPATSTSQPYTSPAATRPKTAATTQPTSPHGTRPATLYYSSGTARDKDTTSSMKSTPAATTPSSATTSTSATRPAATSSTTRPPSAVDYRSNVERQSREQKSVGGVLSVLVYALIGMFLVGASLAGYGAYVISKQLEKQSVTMNDFDKRYAADYRDINAKLSSTLDNLTQAQAQIGRQQELIVKQQETINKLLNAAEDNAAAIRAEKSVRTQETANIRARLKDLEYSGPTTRKY